MNLSDRTLRRLAWAGFSVVLVSLLLQMSFDVVDVGSSQDSWGVGGTIGDLVFGLVILAFPLMGLLILRQQPRNTVGWLLEAVGLVWGLSGLADAYSTYGLLVNPGSVPGPVVVAALNEGAWAPGMGIMGTFLILFYPDGRLPSSRWRPVVWLSGFAMLGTMVAIDFLPGKLEESSVPDLDNPLVWHAATPVLQGVLAVSLPLIPICIVACAVALVRRFRRSRGVERMQLKWLATGGAGVAFLYLVTMVSVALVSLTSVSHAGAAWISVIQTISLLSFGLLPLAIGIAILRHGLYEVDVVINRTLVYGALTVTLAGVYLVSVLVLQLALSPVTRQSDLAVAGSTLAVAALFGPARRGIQRVVDRRFYRSRYNAVRILDEFSGRLRHQVDLDAVGADLRGVVHQSVQPTQVSLWIRP